MKKILNFLIKFSVYALVFLMPLFWLPWTMEGHEFNKQYLLLGLAGIGMVAWLVKMVTISKKLYFRKTPLDLWIVIFLAVMILSSIFSLDQTSSWLGAYGRFSDSIIGLIAAISFYFLIVNNAAIAKKQKPAKDRGVDKFNFQEEKTPDLQKTWGVSYLKIVTLFLISCAIALLSALGSIFELWAGISVLPQAIKIQSFNLAGASLEGLAVLTAVLTVFAVSLMLKWARGTKKKPVLFVLNGLFLLLLILFLMMVNVWSAWLVLAVSSFCILATHFWLGIFRYRPNWLSLPIVILLIAVLNLGGLIERTGLFSNVFFKELPFELVLNQKTAWPVAWKALKEYPVLGAGPASFLSSFTRFKPVEINDSQVWNVRFDRGASLFVELVASNGALGIVAYLLLMAMLALTVIAVLVRLKANRQKKIIGEKEYNQKGLTFMALASASLALAVTQFVYPQNTVLLFNFWLFLALLAICWYDLQPVSSRLVLSFKKHPEVGLVANVVLMFFLFALAGVYYLGGRFYLAEMKYWQLATGNGEDVVAKMEQVVNLNKYRENYRRDLANVYLTSAWTEAEKAEEERDLTLLQTLMANSVEQAKLATQLSPNSVMAWENLGAIYRDAQGLVAGTVNFALEAFGKASELEPTNPVLFRERCRLSLMEEEKDWDKIIGYCQKAIDLKSNYLDAHLQLALALETKGESEKAIEQMQTALGKLRGVTFQRGSDLAVAATEIYFQLGRLYYNLKNFDEAINMFEQAVAVTSEYANGRYALALAYSEKGRKEDALRQLEIVDQLVPGNEEVGQAIEKLKQ